ncbi:MAG: pseudouridine synthase [Uliginosibacterium sp.]|nr:pseudouridine synthase [Uliginosibacterium sp.]
MTDSKPRRLSLPAKTSTTEAEPRRRPPLRGPNKALQVRDGKPPRHAFKAGADKPERPHAGPRPDRRDDRGGFRTEGPRDGRPDARGERPARPSFGDRPPRSSEGGERRDFRERTPSERPRFRSDEERRPRPESREGDSRPPRPRFEGSPERQAGRGSWETVPAPRSDAPREGRSGFREQAPSDRPRFRSDEERRPPFREGDSRPPRPRFEGSPERQAGRGSWGNSSGPRSDAPREGRSGFREQAPSDRPRFRSDDERRPRPESREGDSRPPRPRFEGSPERQAGRGSWGNSSGPRSDAPREGRSGFREQAPSDRPRFRSDDERRPRPESREGDSRPPRPRFEGSPERQAGRGSWGNSSGPRSDAPREGRSGFREQAPSDRPRFRSDDERRPRPESREGDSRPPRPRFEGSPERQAGRGSWGGNSAPRSDAPREGRSGFREQAPSDRPRFRSDDERRPRPESREGDNRPPRPRFEGSPERQAGRGSWGDKPQRERSFAPTPAAPAGEAIRHDDGTVRLSKQMAELGLCSRREADEYIERGWVSVDGVVVSELGSRVRPEQKVVLDPAAEIIQNQRVTILINKPVGYVSGQAEDGYEPAVVLITSENQWEEDPCRIRLEPRFLRKLAPAGRLDIDSTGLLVLTQDGRIAKQLIGNHSDIEKEYLVRVEGTLSEEGMRLLNHGLELDGVELRPAKVSWQNEDQLRFVLREGRKRQIRRMCELVGLNVVGLKRVRIGRITLSKLPPGNWRYLGEHEKF